MKAAGESAKLYFDGFENCEEGDYIRTPSGRTYLITHVRVQARGKWIGRQHLQTVVMEKDHQVEPDAKVISIYWYARN